jgi:hypothetical protein
LKFLTAVNKSAGIYFFVFNLSLAMWTSTAVATDTPSVVDELQQYARDHQLWKKVEWLNLGHYQKDSGSVSGYSSQADDKRFFNADNGKQDPAAELQATLAALYDNSNAGDEHAQCRFIARFNWLQRNIDLPFDALPEVDCKAFKEWRAQMPDHRVTMIFPAYHLNSPSSMFGHNLLRLDPEDREASSDWLSIAVNFGANVNAQDNSIFFAFKGLTGGYPGYFIVTPYFKKIREYNRHENRDIWEYPLNLTPQETRNMVDHLWELKDIKFDYYFFDENCSYRLLELLEVARPEIELTDEYVLTAIPVDTVRSIERAGLITGIDYRPSQATVLEALLEQIPDEQRILVKTIADDPSRVDMAEFTQLDQAQQRRIVDAAYRYLRYQSEDSARTPDSARRSFQLLRSLNSYPAAEDRPEAISAIQPETGHLSRRVSVGGGRDNDRNYAEIGYRMSFHSLEDNDAGFLRGAQINLGNLRIRSTEDDDTQLQRLDLVDIFSLTPRNRFFDPLSWRIYTGLERQLTFGQDRLVSHVTGGAGFTYRPWASNYSYTMLSLRLEHNRGFDDSIEPAAGLLLGSLQHFGWSTARLELAGERFSNDEYRVRGSYTHNFVLARNHALLLKAKREKQPNTEFSEVGLDYQYYF